MTGGHGLVLAAALLAAGCAVYPNDLPANLEVRTTTRSGFLSSVRVTLDIYALDGCERRYLGAVRLGDDVRAVGLAVGEPRELVFRFETGSWLSSTRGAVRYDTVLTPRPEHRYRARVRYVDHLYDVVLEETRPGQRGARRLERRPLECNVVSR